MEYSYYVRDKLVTVVEIDGVVAVKIARDERGFFEAGPEDFGAPAAEPDDPNAALMIKPEQLEAFSQAGWTFVIPNEDLANAPHLFSPFPNAEAVTTVVQDQDGNTKLVTPLLNVQLRPDLTDSQAETVLAEAGLTVVHQFGFARHLFQVQVTGREHPLALAGRLYEDPDFIAAEPEFIEHIPQRLTPTDPDFGRQWQWANDGSGGGTVGADVSAEAAWDLTRGAGIRVCVIDNGMDVNHPDLSPALVTGAGYFVTGTPATFNTGTAGLPSDNHGTFCSGMAIARANNGAGGCGVAFEASWMPVACLTDQLTSQATLARAVAYAADPSQEGQSFVGADVISCSLGPGPKWKLETVLEQALTFATSSGRGGRGTPIFWATTNWNAEIHLDEVVSHPSVIAVGRSTRNDTEGNSGYGPKLDFLAPGVNVYSTLDGGRYGTDTGTSYAAPCAAGIGALVLAVNPDLRWRELQQLMRDTCEKVGGVVYDANGHNDHYGFGRVNAHAAVSRAGLRPSLATRSVNFDDVVESTTAAREIVFTVTSCSRMDFQVVSGPTVVSGPPGTSFDMVAAAVACAGDGSLTPREIRLWVLFAGTRAGATAMGTVTVRCIQTGEEWTIPIAANVIEQPTATVVTNANVVLNSEGWLCAHEVHRIPFRLTETDITANVILEADSPRLLQFILEAPDGAIIQPSIVPSISGTEFVMDSRTCCYRMTLPRPARPRGAREGQWYAIVGRHASSGRTADQPARPLRYGLSVHTRSNLHMNVAVVQSSHDPKATMTVRAVLTEYGIPVEGRARVHARLERAGASKAAIFWLDEIDAGVFEASVEGTMAGIYNLRVIASGSTLRGRIFTREALRTGLSWRGGDQSPPAGKMGWPDVREIVSGIAASLLGRRVQRQRLLARIRKALAGLDES